MASPAGPDSSIFTGQPCAPPCWYGIVAGETGYDALLKLLHQNPHVVQSTIKHDDSPESWGDVSWRYPTSADHGGIAFLRDEIVQVLELDSESQFTMGDAVRRFGQPTKIQIWSGLFGQEQSGYGVLTYYPEVGLGFRFQMRLLLHNNRASVQP